VSMKCNGPFRTAKVLIGVGIAIVLGGMASGQTFSPYSVFQSMSLSDLATLQVKLTYVGPQNEALPTVAATAPGNPVNLALFVPFHRPGISYANDALPVLSFTASPNQLQTMITNVGQLANVTAGTVSANPYLSFALLNTAGGTHAFEAVLGTTDAAALFTQLLAAFGGNSPGILLISRQECSIGIVQPGVPTNVSAQLSVAVSGVRLNRSTGQFVGTATVTNTSTSPIIGPITLVLQLPSGITLFNEQGSTCAIFPQGRPFLNLPVGSLAAGGVAQVTLDFVNPSLLPISVTTTVFAGPGGR
jgi:hypothetical protein